MELLPNEHGCFCSLILFEGSLLQTLISVTGFPKASHTFLASTVVCIKVSVVCLIPIDIHMEQINRTVSTYRLTIRILLTLLTVLRMLPNDVPFVTHIPSSKVYGKIDRETT